MRSNPKKNRREVGIDPGYEWFLELPVPIVLASMWLTGATIISISGLVVCFFWLSLQEVLGV
jgi:hypothetical protein